jgi:hypothetical protein
MNYKLRLRLCTICKQILLLNRILYCLLSLIGLSRVSYDTVRY